MPFIFMSKTSRVIVGRVRLCPITYVLFFHSIIFVTMPNFHRNAIYSCITRKILFQIDTRIDCVKKHSQISKSENFGKLR